MPATGHDSSAQGAHVSQPDDTATGVGPNSAGRSTASPPTASSPGDPTANSARTTLTSAPEPHPVDRRLALAREWDKLLVEVRALPGFENFLRAPTYEDLRQAAVHGPVVTVNLSKWRCDALILTSAGVEAVPLPELSLRDAERRLERHLAALASFDQAVADFEEADAVLQRDHMDGDAIRQRRRAGARRREATLALDDELTSLVEWLWDVVVVVLLDKLPTPGADGLRPRVWWCPTGPLAFLPLHAAGRGNQWLHDMVVSSTTPTVRSLLDARSDSDAGSHRSSVEDGDARVGRKSTERDDGKDAEAPRRRRFLVASTLDSADGLLTGPLGRLVATDVVEASDVAGVRQELATCDFVHFGCHGDQVLTDPSQGGVRLNDGVLRVFDISGISATGEFAGLAACKTAVGGVDLLDEAITLSAALHYAGFRHVVGTLWNLVEGVAQSAFADMYDLLVTEDGTFDPTDAARALAASVDQLRADGEPLHSWASLIHIGP